MYGPLVNLLLYILLLYMKMHILEVTNVHSRQQKDFKCSQIESKNVFIVNHTIKWRCTLENIYVHNAGKIDEDCSKSGK